MEMRKDMKSFVLSHEDAEQKNNCKLRIKEASAIVAMANPSLSER